MELTSEQAEVWRTVQELNRAWAVEPDAERLAHFFHEHMVAHPPDCGRRAGRAAATCSC
ncbi:hypothetical protein KKH27_05560 [bacterium]|nr:hypothetical protein [bacterium]MBU1985312.1 hypothetical protein [bacterium]